MSKKANVISPFLGEHNHQHCQKKAMQAALEQCQSQGLKLTTVRQQVLEIVWSSHKPMGAYDVLQKLQEAGHKPSPPTAYRALDFLVGAKLIHRVESLNAFIGCPAPGVDHQSQFYICTECNHVAELNNSTISDSLLKDAKELGFHNVQPVIEIHGVCDNCVDNQ